MSRQRQSRQIKSQGYATYQGKKAPMSNNRKRVTKPYQGMSGNVTLVCVAVGLLMGVVHAGFIPGQAVALTSTAVACVALVVSYHIGRLGK